MISTGKIAEKALRGTRRKHESPMVLTSGCWSTESNIAAVSHKKSGLRKLFLH